MKINTNTMTMPQQLRVEEIQQLLRKDLAPLRATGRKVLLAYLGLGATVYDSAGAAYKNAGQLFAAAEARGERMKRAFSQRFLQLEEQATHELQKAQQQVGANVQQVKSSVIGTHEEVEDELEKRVELVLANLGIPSRERLERLNHEIEYLNAKLDQELQKAKAGAEDEFVTA